MADGRYGGKYSKCHNSPSNGPMGHNLGGHIPSCPRHVPMMRLPWQRPLPANGALNILQLHDQILKFLKFKVADGRHVGKYWHTITHLAMDLLGRNLAGGIPSRSRHVRQNGVVMATAVA